MKLALKNACPTTKGCEIAHLVNSDIQAAVCDYRGSALGAPCGDPNRTICSPDNKALLRCDATSLKFTVEYQCAKDSPCKPYPGQESFTTPVVSCVPAR
jgi:hypothetical protein